MATGASYTPPAQPKCAYDPYMTHAEAVALRDAGGLDPNCVVVITDGPVIGTAGNTSPTQIELNPVGPSDIGRNARIHTDFDNVAFAGLYNIDDGPNGAINEIVDHWNNRISDEDAGANTVHVQFPYHRSGPNLRDNDINDAILTGWDTASGAINDNQVRNSTVDLTGRTGGTSRFSRNVIENSTFRALTAAAFINDNNIDQALVDHQGTAAGSFSFQNNTMLTGSVTVDAVSTSQLTMNNNIFGGVSGGFRVRVQNFTAPGTPIISGNRMFSQGAGAADLTVQDGGSVSINNNDMTAVNLTAGGAGATTWSGNRMGGTIINQQGGPLRVVNNVLGVTSITTGPANVASTNNFQGNTMVGGSFQLLGPISPTARNDFIGADVRSGGFTVAATATGGIALNGGYFNGVSNSVVQNRTAGTSAMSFSQCDLRGFTTVTDNGTTDPGSPVENSFNRCRFTDTTVTVGNLGGRPGNTIAQQLDCIGSTLDINGLGPNDFLDKGRMLGATLHTNGFQATVFELVGLTKTLTASVSNRYGSSFGDNW